MLSAQATSEREVGMAEEARLAESEGGLVPERDGWLVLIGRDARWCHHDRREFLLPW
jgi:hypothetical protein